MSEKLYDLFLLTNETMNDIFNDWILLATCISLFDTDTFCAYIQIYI